VNFAPKGRQSHIGSTRLVGVTIASSLRSILDWLRAGYPESVPGPDRVPLLALLRAPPLTEDQVKEVVCNLTAAQAPALADGEIGRDEIAGFIQDVTHHDAGPENVRRVAARLAAAGWSLSGVDEAGAADETAQDLGKDPE
jgi:hypothetical protein